MRTVRPRLYSIAFLAGLSACSPPITLTVHAVDGLSAPVRDATLEILGEGFQTTFDATGTVLVPDLRLHGRLGFKITAPGYENAFRSYDLIAGAEHEFSVHLRPAGAVHHVTLPPVGQKLVVTEGMATLGITGGALKHVDGSDVVGDVDVQITPFDPAMREESPATMETVDGRNLMSAGMATITITQGGEALQPKAGQPLEWTMQVNPALGLLTKPTNVRMFYVDETKGLWVLDETATLKWSDDGSTRSWTAQLPHLTVWNADYWWFMGGCITGAIHDAHGNLVTNGVSASAADVSAPSVYDFQTYGFSGSSGFNVNPNQTLLVEDGAGDAVSCNRSDPDCNDDGYKVSAHRVGVSIPSGQFFIGIPCSSDSSGYDGYGCVPVRLSIDGLAVNGQDVEDVTVNGGSNGTSLTVDSLQTSRSTSCSFVGVQLCLEDGQSCNGGDRCCDGHGCNAQGKCGGVQCTANGQACQNGVACCDGQACNVDGMCGPPACTPDGNACVQGHGCCDGQACNAQGNCGALQCERTGQSCSQTSECCAGTCYQSTCLNCADNGASCSGNGDCCAGRHCVEPAPGVGASGEDHSCRDCIPTDHGACGNNSDCCGGFCVGSVCRSCIGTGGSCGGNSDCCNSGLCIQSSCQTCVPAGQPYALGACCPGLSHSHDGTCEVCSATQAACTTGSQCCSGTCSDQLCL